MTGVTIPDPYAALIEPATLRFERLLPGPVERVWAYLVESDKRAKWLASGDMIPVAGSAFTLTWRNDALSDVPETRPEGFPEENSMDSRVIEAHPPFRLVFSWGEHSAVEIDLEEKGNEVLLTLVHRRADDRTAAVMLGSGWHRHLDLLLALIEGRRTGPFWSCWLDLKEEYEARLPR
ncbi:SRPBCC family protein [Martelella sp. HB161492]|uniref:SRPBCC family protein n=1 Tax=Martelella sp. HB161492 TaxID=2720726 RepID=UPI0015900FD4|nr:SRPBCC family protein [Martelella sp. HB161492]